MRYINLMGVLLALVLITGVFAQLRPAQPEEGLVSEVPSAPPDLEEKEDEENVETPNGVVKAVKTAVKTATHEAVEETVQQTAEKTALEIIRLQGHTAIEVWLSLGVLIFTGFGLSIHALIMVKSGHYWNTSSMRAFSAMLICGIVAFLITAGYSNDQLTPAIGLLGTIGGYLLGSKVEKPSD